MNLKYFAFEDRVALVSEIYDIQNSVEYLRLHTKIPKTK